MLSADELIDLILHFNIVTDTDIAVAEIDLDAALLQAVLHVAGLLRVQQDGVVRISTASSNGFGARAFESCIMRYGRTVPIVSIVTMMDIS